MKILKPIAFFVSIFSFNFVFYGQDNSGGGGETAAEASVTTSSSKKSAAAPETIESNPVVTVVKSGLPVQTAIAIPVAQMIKVAESGGTISNLVTTATKLTALKALGKDPAKIIASAVNAIDQGIEFTSASGEGFLEVAVKLDEGSISVAELSTVKSNLTNGVKLSVQVSSGVDYIKSLTDKGLSGTTINTNLEGKTGSELEAAKTTTSNTADLVSQGISESDASSLASSGGDSTLTTFIQSLYALEGADTQEMKELINTIVTIKDSSGNFIYADNQTLQNALTASFAVFSSTFIKDFTGNSAIKGTNAESKLPVEINYASLTAEGGFTPEIIKLLVSYGAIGNKGDQLAEQLGFTEGSTITEFLGTVTDGTSTINQKTATSDFFSLLTTLTGDTDLGDPDGDNDGFLDVSKNSVLNIQRDDITLSPGSKITFGEYGSSETTTVNVSSKLPPASNNNSANKSDPDRKIYVIGSSKDMIIASDVTFTNSNDVEDHALALGSADDLYFRSEYSEANNADYDSPNAINLTYTGSNLGLGSDDTMRLVNVNISTGGNLAIGTLNDLHIGLQDGQTSTFTVGTGGISSDPDNIYLYANNLLSINGLQFGGRVDDVYMDAITINLKNVTFPNTSEVMARSRDGSINAGTGSVNFLGNVKHGTDLITGAAGGAINEFNGIDGHWDLNKKLENGKSAFVIRKR
jgi:hypothetical protein